MTSKQTGRMLGGWLRLWYPGARVQRWLPLGTGVTARVFGVEYAHKQRRKRVVLRLLSVPVELGWRESLLLHTLADTALPVPGCHGVKQDGGTCCMLLEWLPGKTVMRPRDKLVYAGQSAEALAQIHDVRVHPPRLPKWSTGFTSRVAQVRSRYPEHAAMCDLLHRKQAPGTGETLLHGDFWPGNLLFNRRQLTGVIDWSDACIGEPLADLANARLEIRWLWGVEAMRIFTARYLAATGLRTGELLRWWDLAALVKPLLGMHRWGLTPAQTKRLRRAIADHADEALGPGVDRRQSL